jgi:DNA-binding NarL/FixJ family response regulator
MATRVFLVEDNAVIRDSLIEALADMLHVEVVGWAEDEGTAISAMRTRDWDVALEDLFLKQGSGLGVARAFNGRGPAQRLFIATNYATADMRRRCSELGADALFDKSVELDALVEAISARAGDGPRR